MKVVVAGPRYSDCINKIEFTDYNFVVNAILCSQYPIDAIISGNAIGVDRLGERFAIENNIPLLRKPADWRKYGLAAGPIRNKEMAIECDAAVIIWDGESTGSANMIKQMKALSKPHFVSIIGASNLERFM